MRFRKLFSIILILLVGLFAGLFLGRNLLLHYLLEKVNERLNAKYHVAFHYHHAYFKGLGELALEEISIVPLHADTLLSIHSLHITPSYFKLLMGKLASKHMFVDGFHLHLISNDTMSNFSFKEGKETQGDLNVTPLDSRYGEKLNGLFNRTFELITGETQITEFSFEFKSPENYRKYVIPSFYSDGHQYSCNVLNISQVDTISWKVNGLVKKKIKEILFNMTRISENKAMVSLTGEEKGLKWLVDSLQLEIKAAGYNDNRFQLELNGSFNNFLLNYWRVSPDLVMVSNGKMNLIINAGPEFIEIDTSSVLLINKFNCRLGLHFDRVQGKNYILQLKTGLFPAPNLFESLPKGMFKTLQGIKTKGFLDYNLYFSINLENPDSLIFNSKLTKKDFACIQFGDDYLPRINEEFLYTAYDKDKPMRAFLVGPSNPDFTSYNLISTYLKNAVMTSEDGGFFLHAGFNEDAFRQSIATNFKEKRFARGGSTISMQLVKNVYLSRDKTISRKLEEALIVWLIERNRLVSKERLFEVYLNIIEWGPNVYGIKEASRFYFSKLPDQLTLSESIFLASIIPNPKYFKYSFNSSGQLKPYLTGYYRLVSDRMLRKNWIEAQDTINLKPQVQLSGPSLQFILPVDSNLQDSVPLPEMEIN